MELWKNGQERQRQERESEERGGCPRSEGKSQLMAD
jgi:hypothetical protein